MAMLNNQRVPDTYFCFMTNASLDLSILPDFLHRSPHGQSSGNKWQVFTCPEPRNSFWGVISPIYFEKKCKSWILIGSKLQSQSISLQKTIYIWVWLTDVSWIFPWISMNLMAAPERTSRGARQRAVRCTACTTPWPNPARQRPVA